MHTVFWKGVLGFPLNVDLLFGALHFFFKYSSDRREDYQGMEELTNVTAEFPKIMTVQDVYP